MDAAAVAKPTDPSAVRTEEGAEIEAKVGLSAVKEDTIVNRETKLALLIGFVAIVVVTVLVGEHFGKARNDNPATTDLGTSTAAAPSGAGAAGPRVDPITSTPVGTPSAPLAPAATGNGIGNGGTASTGAPAAVQPIELTSTGAPVMGDGTTGAALANGDKNRFIPAAGVDGARGPVLGSETGIPGTQPTNTFGRSPAGPDTLDNTALGNNLISTGVEKMHPVMKGETLASIAQKYYGNKALSKQLGSYNAKRLSSSGSVREGVTLRVPPKDVLLGTAVLGPNAAGKTDSASAVSGASSKTGADKSNAEKLAADKASTEKTKTSGPRTYVIKKGDTLMSIASKELGSAKRWESLVVANPGLEENSLRIGKTIKIPASK